VFRPRGHHSSRSDTFQAGIRIQPDRNLTLRQALVPSVAAHQWRCAMKAFVIGVIAIAIAWVPLVGIVFGAPAVILGGLGLSRATRIQGTGKGFAIAGLVLGAISFLIMIVVSVIVIAASGARPANPTMGGVSIN
jgi:hypothetical protein